MPETAYTVADSPAIVRRIDADLAYILDAVRRADPHLRSLVLTGGFARGEGATLHGVPQNDYDLVAVRGFGRPKHDYAHLRRELETALSFHIDLATVATWRLPHVARSIFWYETALRGRVLWGADLLGQIPIRQARSIDPKEGLRLLVNRGAGLLLVTETNDPHKTKIQAAKAFLAILDSRLLALDRFAPTQTERWQQACRLKEEGRLPADLHGLWPWISWAYRFKVDPARAPPKDGLDAWRVSAQGILDAVPPALRHARIPSLAAYGRIGNVIERARYFWATAGIPGSSRLCPSPTGRVRVATLRILADSLDGVVDRKTAAAHLGALAAVGDHPLRTLEALRAATAQ